MAAKVFLSCDFDAIMHFLCIRLVFPCQFLQILQIETLIDLESTAVLVIIEYEHII
jgi:hypothetical protein